MNLTKQARKGGQLRLTAKTGKCCYSRRDLLQSVSLEHYPGLHARYILVDRSAEIVLEPADTCIGALNRMFSTIPIAKSHAHAANLARRNILIESAVHLALT